MHYLIHTFIMKDMYCREHQREYVMNILIITDMSSHSMIVSLINHADVVHTLIMKDMYCHAQA